MHCYRPAVDKLRRPVAPVICVRPLIFLPLACSLRVRVLDAPRSMCQYRSWLNPVGYSWKSFAQSIDERRRLKWTGESLSVSGREIVALRTAYRQAGRERTSGLATTRNAALPICLPAASLDAERRCATASAAAWSAKLRVRFGAAPNSRPLLRSGVRRVQPFR